MNIENLLDEKNQCQMKVDDVIVTLKYGSEHTLEECMINILKSNNK